MGCRGPGRRKPNLIDVYTPVDLVNRRFTAARPNELWCTDITEHPARDGKVYCCAILDCFSRMIVARTFSTTSETALVNNAVNMAVDNRTRSGPTILHADRGSWFTSWNLGRTCGGGSARLIRHGGRLLRQRRQESFWARMQVELLNTRKWHTTIELVAAMADYVDNFYNVERRHSYLGNISPRSSKRSGHPPVRSLNSHDRGSKQRGQISWTQKRGLATRMTTRRLGIANETSSYLNSSIIMLDEAQRKTL